MNRWTGLLPTLPAGARLMLTAFLAIIAAGYLIAVANIFERHGMADAREGLSTGDIRAVYSGGPRAAGEAVTSHMLTMLAGSMRQYVSSEFDYAILETWLKAGGSEAGLDESPMTPSSDGEESSSRRRKARTPRRIIIRDCMRCHAQSSNTDIARIAPFGKDEFDVDYAMLSKFISGDASGAPPGRSPPQYDRARLILHSHQHMLSIPMFTMAVGVLFMLTRTPSALKSILLPIPMLAAVVDFASWWLARTGDVWTYAIAVAGGVFGISLAIQIAATVIDLWRPLNPQSPHPGE